MLFSWSPKSSLLILLFSLHFSTVFWIRDIQFSHSLLLKAPLHSSSTFSSMDILLLILYAVTNFSSHFSTHNELMLNVFFCSGVLSEMLILNLVNLNNIATEAQKFNLVQTFYNHSSIPNLNISICFHLCVCIYSLLGLLSIIYIPFCSFLLCLPE